MSKAGCRGGGRVLITRPMPEAQGYARELCVSGFDVLCAPMLVVRERDFMTPHLPDYQGLVFTSAQAVRFFSNRVCGRDCRVFCVGDYTADVARDLGFSVVYSAAGVAADLLPLVQGYVDGGRPFLHVRGEVVARDLSEDFAALGLDLCPLIVYGADYVETMAEDCLEAIRAHEVRAVTFFSKRTAVNFMRIVEAEGALEDLRFIKVLCISRGVVECVRAELWAGVDVAVHPDRHGMFELLQKL